MSSEGSREKSVLGDLEELKQWNINKDYFKVVVLSPQLIVEAIDILASYSDEWFDRKHAVHFSNDDKHILNLISQLQKKESDRSYIVGALGDAYNAGIWPEKKARKEFVKYFTKLDDLISLRNIYAHEFYSKKTTSNRAKNCSKSGIQILEFFTDQFE